MIVLDASATVAWLLKESGPAAGLDELVVGERLVVPAHWAIEVGHAIVKALRRKRIGEDRLDLMARELSALGLTSAPPLNIAGFVPMIAFASAHGLTMYDASYVHLALERSAALATLDGAMRKAAQELGVRLVL